MKFTKKKLSTFLICFFVLTNGYAQVTIGSDKNPAEGALLDLKEYDADATTNNTTSTRGLGMPRVSLQNIKGDLAKSLDPNQVAGSLNHDEHKGLVVYNINEDICMPLRKGLYVWDGQFWQYLGINKNNVQPIQVETAENSDRVDWATAWQDNVILHEEKIGVYRKFISASFGDAGRWMVTNMTAESYDGVSHLHRTLSGPNGNASDAYNTAFWAYPSSISAYSNIDYDINPYMGYLYTWDAASGGKSGEDGLDDLGDEGGVPSVNGRYQGVCPNGWYLPEDMEWTQLENEIKKNTSKYSGTADISNNETSLGNETIEDIAIPMKAYCNTPNSTPNHTNGTSFAPELGGFNILLTGMVNADLLKHYGEKNYFWTSSTKSSTEAWARHIESPNAPTLKRENYLKYNMFSVRCKKRETSPGPNPEG